jgi:hypothetical protein
VLRRELARSHRLARDCARGLSRKYPRCAMGPPKEVRSSFRNAVKTSGTGRWAHPASSAGTGNQRQRFIASPVNSRTRTFARASPCFPTFVAL